MSKLTIVLLVLFVGALALLGIVITHPLMFTFKLEQAAKQALSTDQPQTILSMDPETITLSASGSAQISINVNTESNTIGTAQFEIGYDPKALTVTAISPGTFFPHQQVLISDIDASTGRISFAESTTQEEKKGSGVLATLTVWARYPVLSQTALTFYPKTSLMHLGQTTSLVSSESGTTILFPVFHPPVIASGSAISATNAALPAK